MRDYITIIRDNSFKRITIEGKEQLDKKDITSQAIYSTCINDKSIQFFINSIKSENAILHYKNNYHVSILVLQGNQVGGKHVA